MDAVTEPSRQDPRRTGAVATGDEAARPAPSRPAPPRPAPLAPTAVALAVWVVLIATARLVGERLYEADPLVRIGNPPLVGAADLRLSAWALPALAFALAAVAFAPALAQRLSPRRLLAAVYAAALAWPPLLALSDGPRALAEPLQSRYEYLHDVGRVGSPGRFLSDFTELLPTYATHVKGHPPGMVLLLAGLDTVGFGGATAATVLVLLVAALAAPAALIALRAVAGTTAMRAAAPFVPLAPAAVWVATSADGLFMGIGACAVACVVLAACHGRARGGRRADALALVGGLLFGTALLLTYGAVLLGVIPAAVALHRRRIRPLLLAAIGAGTVVLGFALAGFWWLDGLNATRELYAAGVASRRPYLAFALIDLGALALATGPAVAVGLARLRNPGRPLPPRALLPAGALLAVTLATVSGMSRGEVERIWLPFMPWLLLATCALPRPRRWLAAQLALALTLQLGARSPW
ncbi:MAG TPA: hypothetical protein VLK58_21465 [Conexibacter sp.]|nr:hypothetical protein [Conexibacter sp.]